MKFLATITVPGYLPMDDDPPVFDTAQAAWEYLADERQRDEDDSIMAGTENHDDDGLYSDTYNELVGRAQGWARPVLTEGVVTGDTPGYDGDHDLGLAYCVTVLEESEEG